MRYARAPARVEEGRDGRCGYMGWRRVFHDALSRTAGHLALLLASMEVYGCYLSGKGTARALTGRQTADRLTLLSGNVSQVDRLWTILPMVYSVHFTMWPKWSGTGELDQRMLLVMGLQFLWSARLTTNTYRRGFFNP
jgi:hypothetical protein